MCDFATIGMKELGCPKTDIAKALNAKSLVLDS